jgi:hypothetical protein
MIWARTLFITKNHELGVIEEGQDSIQNLTLGPERSDCWETQAGQLGAMHTALFLALRTSSGLQNTLRQIRKKGLHLGGGVLVTQVS